MGHTGLFHSITCPSQRHLHFLTASQQYLQYTVKRKQKKYFLSKHFDYTTPLCVCMYVYIHTYIYKGKFSTFELSIFLYLRHVNPISSHSFSQAKGANCAMNFVSHLSDRVRHLHTGLVFWLGKNHTHCWFI